VQEILNTADRAGSLGGHDGHIYLHENGHNNDGAAIRVSLTLVPFALNDGAGSFELDGIRLGVKDQAGDLTVGISAHDAPCSGVIDSVRITAKR
jgi:hypothetical protein